MSSSYDVLAAIDMERVGEHPELRVGHLDEILGGQGGREGESKEGRLGAEPTGLDNTSCPMAAARLESYL